MILKVGGIDFEQVIDYMRRNPEQFILKRGYTQLEGFHHLEATMGRRLDEALAHGTSLPGASSARASGRWPAGPTARGGRRGAAQHFPPVTAARPSRSKFVSACADRENEP